MIVAYDLAAPDLGAHYYTGAPRAVFCPSCGNVVDEDYAPSEISLFRYEAEIDYSHEDEPLDALPEDVGYTYDGHCLVSERFRRTCKSLEIDGIDFMLVNRRLRAYDLRPRRILRFDAERRKTRFIGHCVDCDDHLEVIGAHPVFLRDVVAPITDGIFRTDLRFGSRRGRHFSIIVGVRTKERLEAEGLRGMEFRPIAP